MSRPPAPLPVRRALEHLGADVAAWRKLQQLTVAQVADRADVSPNVVRGLESGAGATLTNVMRITRALGVLYLLEEALDPAKTDLGRLRADALLPTRVRRSKGE